VLFVKVGAIKRQESAKKLDEIHFSTADFYYRPPKFK
jgi:hypothetical protein